jgi:hypothetical protein
MAITRQVYSVIQRELKARKMSVTLNATWMWLHEEYEIGRVVGNSLKLTNADHAKLRKIGRFHTGGDLLSETPEGGRLEVAARFRDEKLATENVFAGMVRVSMRNGTIPLLQGEAVTPPGTLLSVNITDLEVERLTCIVVVENGVVARAWHRCRIPAHLESALMVYRGHDHESRTVRLWLDELTPKVKKIGYFDFDPAGIAMALDIHLDSILIPDDLSDDLVAEHYNKPQMFLKQRAQRPDLDQKIPQSMRSIWEWMTEDGRQCAVTQESLTVRNWPLCEVSLR